VPGDYSILPMEQQTEAALAEDEARSVDVERCDAWRECRFVGHDLESIVGLEKRLVDGVDATRDEVHDTPGPQKLDTGDDRGETRRFFVAHGGVRAPQLELHARQAGRGVPDGAFKKQRRRVGRAAAEERRQVLLRRLSPRCPCAENHAGLIVAIRCRHAFPVFERETRQRDRVHASAVEASQLHRRDPRGRLEAGGLRGDSRTAAFRIEPDDRRDRAASLEKGTHEGGMCGAECGDDAETGHADGELHGRVRYHDPMRHHTAARWAARLRWAGTSAVMVIALAALLTAQQKPVDDDSFDALYRRGSQINATFKTLQREGSFSFEAVKVDSKNKIAKSAWALPAGYEAIKL